MQPSFQGMTNESWTWVSTPWNSSGSEGVPLQIELGWVKTLQNMLKRIKIKLDTNPELLNSHNCSSPQLCYLELCQWEPGIFNIREILREKKNNITIIYTY